MIREELNTTKFPRRIRLDLNTPAELAIFNAMQEVEKAGADVRLTEATMLLAKAKDCVADFVDGVEHPLPPAEGATDKFRDVLNEVQRLIEINDGATGGELRAIWNSLSCAITESEKKPHPTAEGAEEIFNKYQADAPMKTRFINFNEAIKAMHEFAALHAQRLAEKMVEERMEQYKAQFKDRPNPRDVNPYDSKGIKRIRNRKIR